MVKLLITFIFLALTFCSKINEIEIHRRESSSQNLERNFFYNLFSKHGSLESFIKENSYKSFFFSKYKKEIKKYYTDFKRMKTRMNYLSGNQVFEQPMINQALSVFYSIISVGTPPQPVSVEIDTGSSDLLVPSYTFNPNKSSTYSSTGAKFEIEYGSGATDTGFSANDTVHIAGLSVENFQFAIIPNDYHAIPEGLIGLAYQQLSRANPKSPSLIDQLYKQKKVEEPVFSLYLTHNYSQNGSKLILGGIVEDYYVGPIHYIPLSLEQWYTIKYQGYQVGDQIFEDSSVILDSGTTLIHAPQTIVDNLTKLVGDIDPNCNGIDNSKYPVINVLIDGQKYPLNAEDYIFYSAEVYKKCIFAITNHFNAGSILGDQFLKVYYSVFDQGGNRVGLAKAKHQS